MKNENQQQMTVWFDCLFLSQSMESRKFMFSFNISNTKLLKDNEVQLKMF